MTGFLTILVPIILLLIMFAWGILLGIGRVRLRGICVGASFVAAVIAAYVVKGYQYYQLMDLLRLFAGNAADNGIFAFIQSSELLQEALTACGGALISPLMFFVVFFALNIVSGVICYIYFIVTLVIRFMTGEATRRKSPGRVLAYAAGQVVLTLIVIMTPVVCYADCLPNLINAVTDAGLLPKEPEYASDVNVEKLQENIDLLNKAPLTVAYRKVGGDLFCQSLTVFEIDGENTNISKELAHLATFLGNVYKLGQSDIYDYDEEQAEAIRGMSADFENSLFLTTVAGEVIYGATDAWLQEGGTFIGVAKPDLSGESAEIFAPIFDHILVAFHNDARDAHALSADFNTFANVILILSENDILAHMRNAESSDDMVRELTTGTTVSRLVDELKKNSSLAILADDITDIGMRAVGSTIQISSKDAETFENFTDDIAGALNDIRVEGSTREEQKEAMTDKIHEALENSGTDIKVDDSIVDLYSEKLLDEFADKETITAEDISELFKAYTSANGGTSEGDSTLPELPDGLPELPDGLPELPGDLPVAP